MAAGYEQWMGRRYVRSRSGNSFVSLISAISMLGIAVAVAVLIVVLSVVNGFERELQNRLLAMTAHATIEESDNRLENWRDWVTRAEEHPEVAAAAPFVNGQGLLNNGSRLSGVQISGIEPELEVRVSKVADALLEGDLSSLGPRSFNIVLGTELARELDAEIGDKVTLTLAEGRVTPVGVVPRNKRFTVSGIYRIGMFEFDRRVAFVNLEDAQRLFRLRDDVSGIRLAVTDIYQAPQIVREVALDSGGGVLISDWTRRHVNFFRSIQITKSILFVILLMIVAVAAFNIVSTLVMVVKDKQSDIAILRSFGATPSGILKIFITQGSLIGFFGTVAGVALGTLVSLNLEDIVAFMESAFGIKFLAADVYFISDLPADLRLGDVLRVAAIALVLALLSTLYPAWRGARTMPAEALRYE
ncbi:MAG: lipoprotein-releasing ABC transporter permease subunit [Woeseiaceae bacterium]|nr:lipoprotein-releasing ABC transporter permease subunit [Woeseiaceae bacterium]